MASKRTPPLLLFWMLLTRVLAWPLAMIFRVSHHRMGGDPKRFSERLGHGAAQNGVPVIWFHAASLGEVMQIEPLAHDLTRSQQIKILVTTNTVTGAQWVARQMPYVTHRYAPLDTPAAVRRFLQGWSISVAVFVEGDLWPRLLRDLHKRDVPRVLLNARHSRTRRRIPAVFEALLNPFSAVTCRSDAVAQDMRALGVPADRVHVLPDLRLTLSKLAVNGEALETLRRAVGSRPVWLAASTHLADEDAVLGAQQDVLAAFPDALLVLAPRHPTRGQPLQKLAGAKNLTTARRSLGESISATTQIYIADTLGELGVFFTLCPIAFIGGSFGHEGGHNPYEPAHFETAIVYGPRVKNFSDAYEALRLVRAARQVEDPKHLGTAITGLLSGDQAMAMGQAGQSFIESSKSCASSYVDLITSALKRQQTGDAPSKPSQ